MMSISERAVSVFPKAFVKEPSQTMTPAEVMKVIKGHRLKQDIERLRGYLMAGDKDAYDRGKPDLMGVSWSGTFSRLKKDGLITHSGLIVADFDHLGEDLPRVRAALEADQAVVICFTSPSGDGLKAVYAVSDPSDHGRAWQAVADQAKHATGVDADKSGKDVSRLCFLSHDPDCYYNETPVPVAVPAKAPADPEPKKAEAPKPTTTATANATRAERYCRSAFDKAVAAVCGAREGGRNQALNDEAIGIFGFVAAGHLDKGEVIEAFKRAAIGAGLPEAEAMRTIQSAMEAGMKHPREIPERETPGRESTTRTDEAGMLTIPTEERPCFRVFDDWFEIREASGKLKPGVYYFGAKESKKSDTPPAMINQWICSPLYVDAVTFDGQESNFGRMLRFRNTLGKVRTWAMPMELLKGSGDELRGELLAMGVVIDPGSRQLLERYINSVIPDRRVHCALQVGWCGECYVLPDIVYGPNASEIIYQSGERGRDEHTTAGTLDGWKAEVSARAVDNPLLILGLSSSFAGPMLSRCVMDSGGIHFYGNSSTGKTTIVEAACSVWGGRGFMRTWHATANGLEGAACLFNDCLLSLDEIKQCNPKDVSEIIYSLGNGRGKQRASRTGRARGVTRWRCSLLSSGERTIETHMAEAGLSPHAGQLVRLLDIPADRAYGAWDYLHGLPTGAAFSDALRVAASKHHGHAGRAFLERLTADTRNFRERHEAIAGLSQFATDGEDGQPKRAADRFAVIALAGELATEYGITGWKEGAAIQAAGEAFQNWNRARGDGNDEPKRIMERISDYIDRNGDSLFTDADREEVKCLNRSGWWKKAYDGERVYLFTPAGMKDALNGFDKRRAHAVLQDAGVLRPGSDAPSKTVRIQGQTKRIYEIRLVPGGWE